MRGHRVARAAGDRGDGRAAHAADAGGADRGRIGPAEFESTLAYGILAPRGTPEAVLQEIHVQIARVAATREFRERIKFEGAVPLQGTSAEFAALIRAQAEKWGRVIRASSIKPE